MVSHMHNVFCSFSAAEYLQVSATLQKFQDVLLGRSNQCISAVRKQYKSNIYLIIWLLPEAFAETRWKNAEHSEKIEADSALALNVQRISLFLTDCKKSQLFLRMIFESRVC